jgi:hypothetical protein
VAKAYSIFLQQAYVNAKFNLGNGLDVWNYFTKTPARNSQLGPEIVPPLILQ